jgi:hypothetical protein
MSASSELAEFMSIPTVRLDDPDAPAKLKHACEHVGFFYCEFFGAQHNVKTILRKFLVISEEYFLPTFFVFCLMSSGRSWTRARRDCPGL